MDAYLFSVGAIREVEKKLFDNNDMERMIDAPDVKASFKIFNDLSYADELLDMESPKQYREILAHDLKQVRDFFINISPNKELTNLILAYYDFYNLKIIFKSKYANKEEAIQTSPLGGIAVEKLKEIILQKNIKQTLPDAYHSLVKEAFGELEKKHEPQEIDSYFDKKYSLFILERAYELKDDYLLSLIKVQIDLANIKIVVRSKLLGRLSDDVRRDIIPQGNISDYELLNSYNNDLVEIIKTIQKNFTDMKIINDLNKFLEDQKFWQLEKNLDNYFIRLIKELNMKSQGPGVLVAYFLAKKNAIRNIQIIMTGKINKLSSQEIKETVRDLY